MLTTIRIRRAAERAYNAARLSAESTLRRYTRASIQATFQPSAANNRHAAIAYQDHYQAWLVSLDAGMLSAVVSR